MHLLNGIPQKTDISTQMSDPYIKCPKKKIFVLTNETILNEIFPHKTCSEIQVVKAQKINNQKNIVARLTGDQENADDCKSEESTPEVIPRTIKACPYTKLTASDEISISSIVSEILSFVQPTEEEIKDLKWEINARAFYNDKQAMIFADYLHIYNSIDGSICGFQEKAKVFEKEDLTRVGKLKFEVQETCDGYAIHSWSEMRRDRATNNVCGHELKGKYDNRFMLIVERRMEYNPLEKATVIKRLTLRNVNNVKIEATRETCINESRTTFKAEIETKGRPEPFIGDGGATALMRFLVINHYTGRYEFYSMSLFGKMVHCVMNISEERETIRVFHETYHNLYVVTKTEYFDEEVVEVSESYLTAKGKLILHFWHNYNYVLHCCRPMEPPKEVIIPRMELVWKADNVMQKLFLEKEKLYRNEIIEYFKNKPEVKALLRDYIRMLLRLKPTSEQIFRHTIEFFTSFTPTKRIDNKKK